RIVLQTGSKSVTAVFEADEYLFDLPLIMFDYPGTPNLVVEELVVDENSIEVTIMNMGDTAVTDEFWVDVYIDPGVAPNGR
ncbi:MAG: hypothetical protein GY942_18175, partial [Aestuariibacter sp.]|nr:hypothetical protein [Aestuariibacter sp.]